MWLDSKTEVYLQETRNLNPGTLNPGVSWYFCCVVVYFSLSFVFAYEIILVLIVKFHWRILQYEMNITVDNVRESCHLSTYKIYIFFIYTYKARIPPLPSKNLPWRNHGGLRATWRLGAHVIWMPYSNRAQNLILIY